VAKVVARYEVLEDGSWQGSCPEVTHFRVTAPTFDEVKAELYILIRAILADDTVIADRVL